MEHVCPRQLTEDAVLPFLNELASRKDDANAGTDFSSLSFGEPFGTLLLAEGLRAFVAYRKERGLETHVTNASCVQAVTSSAISYLLHVGFFQFIGLPFGNAPAAASGSSSYFPITVITQHDLLGTLHGGVIQDAVKLRSDTLASLVFDDDMQRIMLSYCFREIIRNVFEHANATYCVAMAQRWGDVVEIAIVDRGRGIHASLSETRAIDSADAAIREAIKPGVTRIQGAQGLGAWDNSGFGLFVVSELGKRCGNCTIASSGVAIKLDAPQIPFTATPLSGTAIKLKVNTENAEFFPNLLETIIREGESITGFKQTASKSSGLW